MSEQFNNKDYKDYFSALEKSLDKNNQTRKSVRADIRPEQQRKTFGKVIKLRPRVYYITALVLAVALLIVVVLPPKANTQKTQDDLIIEGPEDPKIEEPQEEQNSYFAKFDQNTKEIAEDIDSKNIIVINCNTNKVVAARNHEERCYPASTTKIMTILTAVDYIKDYDKTFTFSYEITDPLYVEEATMAGFADGEAVNMTDMLYGAILPSGADATIGIAKTVAGSEREFVKLMNQKAKSLGLKNTNFTNASGLFDKSHYTTAEDMAVIVKAAMENELCRKILSTYQYTTAATPQNPKGIPLTSTLFSHMYGTEPEGADILGGKTGFVNESGYCIASFGKSDSGTEYICVTLKGLSLWPTFYDQIDLYSRYAK